MEKYNFIKTDISGTYIVESSYYEDISKFFIEVYPKDEFERSIGVNKFVEDMYFFSDKGVIKGLHYQKVKPQGRLIRVISGGIYNVYVDIREKSKTFGQWRGIYLSSENNKQVYIPKGFANGFLALSDSTEVIYKCDEITYPEYKSGIIWNDPILNINWYISYPIVSNEDMELDSFIDYISEMSQ